MSTYLFLRTIQHQSVLGGASLSPPSFAGQPIGLLLALTYAS